MKKTLTTFFSPILNYFEPENGGTPKNYKKSYRTILIAVGCLFSLLAAGVIAVGLQSEGYGFVLPGLIFASAGFVSLLIGFLGSDGAVARIWNSRS